MLGSYEQYRTSRDAYSIKKIIKLILKLLLLLFVFYIFVSSFVINTFRADSVSMSPGIAKGDKLLCSPLIYGTYSTLLGFRFPGFSKPARGDIVVVRMPYNPGQSFLLELINPLLNFLSLRSGSGAAHEYAVKRIVGIPGDALKIVSYQVYVRPKGEGEFKSEGQLAESRYKIDDNAAERSYPAGWQSGLPFSGNMQEIVLGPDEYFVMGDNRLLWSDSRFLGPVSFDYIVGKVLVRYWPFEKFGGL
jgi:signal peptidase I